jgi:hypothetical protein
MTATSHLNNHFESLQQIEGYLQAMVQNRNRFTKQVPNKVMIDSYAKLELGVKFEVNELLKNRRLIHSSALE